MSSVYIFLLLLLYTCVAIAQTEPWKQTVCLPENRKDYIPPINKRGKTRLTFGKCNDINSFKFACYGQRNEDCKIYKRFFKDDLKWRNGSSGFFVEMGGFDGVSFSNSFIYEQCLGWKGLLIEADPRNYLKMIENRPCTYNVWGAVCPTGSEAPPQSHHFMIHDFVQKAINSTEIAERNAIAIQSNVSSQQLLLPKMVPCRSMRSIFQEAEVSVVDFFSLDVEGAELDVLHSIDFTAVRINVIMVEIEMLGNRNENSANFYNSTNQAEQIEALLTKPPANMIKLPSLGKDVPACTRQKKKLPIRVFDLYGSDLYVHSDFRDDICQSEG